MRVPATADALRVARALLDISQRVAAERAGIVQKSVSAAESGRGVLLESNLALVDYYNASGIVLLGEGQIGGEIQRSGAMWSGPADPAEIALLGTGFHSASMSVSFRAARAFLGEEQSAIARLAHLSVDTVKVLERGREAHKSYDQLRDWYEGRGVEFTGWGDIASRRFLRVGVRWRK